MLSRVFVPALREANRDHGNVAHVTILGSRGRQKRKRVAQQLNWMDMTKWRQTCHLCSVTDSTIVQWYGYLLIIIHHFYFCCCAKTYLVFSSIRYNWIDQKVNNYFSCIRTRYIWLNVLEEPLKCSNFDWLFNIFLYVVLSKPG